MTELFPDIAAVRKYIAVSIDDTDLEYIVDSVDQDMIDFAGPHSGSHTVNGLDGIAILQPRPTDGSTFTVRQRSTSDEITAYEATGALVRAETSVAFTVTYTVDTDEVKRRRAPFVELLKLRLGYNPQAASLPTGLAYSTTPIYDRVQYDAILRGLLVLP